MRDWNRYVREHLPSEALRVESVTEIHEEIADHLEDTYSEALARGATEAEAEALALAEVEDWERLAAHILRTRKGAAPSPANERAEAVEEALRNRGTGWIRVADIVQEMRFTFRRLRRAPGFTSVVLLTLGVGIGATTAVFSVVKGVLLDPLPYDDAGQLVSVWNAAPAMGEDQLPQSLAVNAIYEDEARGFEDVGIWYPQNVPVLSAETPEELSAISVTDGTLRALRVQPFLGHLFTREDIESGSPLTVILSHRYWVDRMGADPNVVGRTVTVWQSPYEVIGVLPRSFRLMDRDPDLYLPLRYNRSSLTVSSFVFHSLARLRDGVSQEEALAEMARVVPLAPERYPGGVTAQQLEEMGARPVLHPLKEDLVGGVRSVLWVVLGGVGIILLVACANVANLLLVRSEAGGRAVAIQTALGAGWSRLVARFLTESGTLAALGGALGLAIAYGGLELLRVVGPAELPRLHDVTLNPAVLLFAVAVSGVVGLTVGLLPLARAWASDPVTALSEGDRSLGGGRASNRARNTLVVVQLALALVLLVGSGLMIRSFVGLMHVAPGYSDPDHLLTFRLGIDADDMANWEDQVASAHERLAQRVAEIPGVTSVGLSSSVPMDGRGGFDPVFVEDFPLATGQQAPIRRFKWLGGGYATAIGNPVLAGRAISWEDIRHHARVVMITEDIAREYWGDPEQAVGRRISTGFTPGDWREIVGVVGNVRDDGIEQDPVGIVYWPMVMDGFWSETRGDAPFVQQTMTYVVRSPRVGTPGFLDEVRDVVQAACPTEPLGSVRTMESLQRDSMARTSFTLVMLALAAAVALLLGAVGTYGVVSYVVGRRTRELGIRMAMGADPGAVTGMVLRQGLVLALVGVGVGLGLAAVATRLMGGILFGVSPLDPLTYLLVAVVLPGVALLATYLPARRAAALDPSVALRSE